MSSAYVLGHILFKLWDASYLHAATDPRHPLTCLDPRSSSIKSAGNTPEFDGSYNGIMYLRVYEVD